MLENQIASIVEEIKKSLENSEGNEKIAEKLQALWTQQRILSADDRERFRAVVDNVYEGVITINSKGRVDSYNLAAETIFGYRADEVIGQNIKMLMPEPYYSEHDGYLANYMGGGEAKIIGLGREVVGRRKDGSVFPLYLAVTQIHEKETPLFIGMVRDISEQKHLEQLKNEFVSTVSHELRTPLTSIRGALSLIESGVMGEVGAKILPLVKIALNNSERLILLINDILDIEKIESGKMNFDLEKVELNSVIEQAVIANEGYAKEHEVKLFFSKENESINVYVDMNRMQQVLTNLISNAVKYSPKNETVNLRTVHNNRWIRIEVMDKGPGIPEEFKKRIFQKFAQADSSDTKKRGGTGLGLNITKTIVEKFGGNIGFLSPKGEGTTFFVNLPILSGTHEEAVHLSQSSDKVLIVEDDHDIATLLRLILENENIQCDIAYNADEAKKMLHQNKYQAMTLDIMLPGQNGISFLEDIRKEKFLKDFPVVIVSAKADTAKNQSGKIALEVVNWINKPIDHTELIASLNKAIGAHTVPRPMILHVEDDLDIASLIKTLLEDVGDVHLALNKAEAISELSKRKYDLILLDMMLPDGTGEEIVDIVNKHVLSVPIIFFSAQEIDNGLKAKVAKTLVKSRTSDTLLVDTIKQVLEH